MAEGADQGSDRRGARPTAGGGGGRRRDCAAWPAATGGAAVGRRSSHARQALPHAGPTGAPAAPGRRLVAREAPSGLCLGANVCQRKGDLDPNSGVAAGQARRRDQARLAPLGASRRDAAHDTDVRSQLPREQAARRSGRARGAPPGEGTTQAPREGFDQTWEKPPDPLGDASAGGCAPARQAGLGVPRRPPFARAGAPRRLPQRPALRRPPGARRPRAGRLRPRGGQAPRLPGLLDCRQGDAELHPSRPGHGAGDGGGTGRLGRDLDRAPQERAGAVARGGERRDRASRRYLCPPSGAPWPWP